MTTQEQLSILENANNTINALWLQMDEGTITQEEFKSKRQEQQAKIASCPDL